MKDTGFDYISWSYYYCSSWTGECDCVVCCRGKKINL